MTPTLPISIFSLLSTSLLLSSILHHSLAAEVGDPFPVKQHEKPITREKISHFRVYWHDIVSGANPTSITIVKPPKAKRPAFGQINMIDDPLTVGLESSSEVVGRAQGLYASASQKELGLLMTMNFVFTTGKYNGSSITILGRNAVFDKVREMPVIGGTGLFRFARGYVKAQTRRLNMNTFDATVEYNVYGMHY